MRGGMAVRTATEQRSSISTLFPLLVFDDVAKMVNLPLFDDNDKKNQSRNVCFLLRAHPPLRPSLPHAHQDLQRSRYAV